LKPSTRILNSQISQNYLTSGTRNRSIRGCIDTKTFRVILLLAAAFLVSLPLLAKSQELPDAPTPSNEARNTTSAQLDSPYVRPTRGTKVNNYIIGTFGPYPVVGAALAAGINQASDSPPEWNQGAEGYAKRFGSNFGIAAVSTTTRYGLAEIFKEDTLYYRCQCKGFLPRLSHAMISTLTSRRGDDGRRVFSFPALIAPYAGSMTATYGWYPDRYGAKDAFRTGNYNLLASMGGNIVLEFFYGGSHSLLHRMHLNNTHGSPIQGPNQ
jgi:hypothetical protein